ncbi:hypothetical protein RGF97_02395 [Streptomyces roseicoloratus]|uniref:DUF8094 domain-containing protein n=1 Tax=Streptomyces roseicoloratus TaxID=2508722 RepID=A0ABY9RP26_9ACTN|nr:hypothetical protein [Streptomyces roseicoloratus]WMX43941.1 hypothetical protein RGF97_02395 [Streptomyces roseicoloratus]
MRSHAARRLVVGGVAVLLALSTGCSSGERPSRDDGVASPTPSGQASVISRAEAERVFARYDRTNAAADGALDDTAIREVQTGVLLDESLAAYDIHRRARTSDRVTRFTQARFLIPAVDAARPYPRYFAVLSKRKGLEDDRSSQLFYFTQTEEKGPWKATAATWAVTEPPRSPSPSESTPPPPTGNDKVVRLRPKVLPGIGEDASGAALLSPTEQADRAVCAAFADYLSFSPPQGRPVDDRFAPGGFTSDLVRHFNGWANKNLQRSLSYRTTGADLPVFRLSDGGALVACTYRREFRSAGASPTGTVRFEKGSDTDVLLGGGGREWRSVLQVSSVTALVEVPAKKGAPATVLACDCYAPQPLSATGTRP